MTENIPPNVNGASGDATRGLPYYEKLKRDLRDTIQKKRALDKNMTALEEQIYRFEGSYLEETGAGNIIKGFDNYIKGSGTSTTAANATGGSTATRKKGTIVDHDRVFSRSSASFMRESSPQSSAQNTPHAPTPTLIQQFASLKDSNQPTPTGSVKGGSSLKRTKKAIGKEDDENENKPKRLKITYARGEKGGE